MKPSKGKAESAQAVPGLSVGAPTNMKSRSTKQSPAPAPTLHRCEKWLFVFPGVLLTTATGCGSMPPPPCAAWLSAESATNPSGGASAGAARRRNTRPSEPTLAARSAADDCAMGVAAGARPADGAVAGRLFRGQVDTTLLTKPARSLPSAVSVSRHLFTPAELAGLSCGAVTSRMTSPEELGSAAVASGSAGCSSAPDLPP